MELKEHYKWEAETADGEIITEGGDLRGCVRFSLIPQIPGLPPLDVVGVPLVKRFCRSFSKTHINQRKKLPGLFYWEDGSRIVKTSEDITETLYPGSWIGKGVDGEDFYPVADVQPDHVRLVVPYRGNSKPNGMQAKQVLRVGEQTEHYFHCVETKAVRLWVDYRTGRVLTTPKKYEHYI